jgi:hypothetical protein
MKAVWQWLAGMLVVAWLPCVVAQSLLMAEPVVELAASAGETGGAVSSVVQLEYREVPYTLHHSGLVLDPCDTPFDREPLLERGQPVRGRLQGADLELSIPFLWDRGGGRLHLDLNRNGDLTDDPNGVFASGDRHSYQVFKGVSLPVKGGSARTILTDLGFHQFHRTTYCTVNVRAYWSGQIRLQDSEWEIGVVEHPLRQNSRARSHLLLRPWQDRDARFSASTTAADVLPWPDQLFLDGQAWEITRKDQEVIGICQTELRLTPQSPQLGELRIEGEFIEQLGFESASWPVLLRQPASAVQMPIGRYPRPRVLLASQGVQASRQASQMPQPDLPEFFEVPETGAAALKVGGPLTNTVRVTRHGRSLFLHYELVGAAGETYQLVEQARLQSPRFAVYRGDKEIASGAFEYG